MKYLKVLAAAVAVAVVPIVNAAPASAQFAVLDAANLSQNTRTQIQTYLIMFHQLQQLQMEIQNNLRNPGQYANVLEDINTTIGQMRTLKNNLAVTDPTLQAKFIQQHPGGVPTLNYSPLMADRMFGQLVNNRLGSSLAMLNVAANSINQAVASQRLARTLGQQNDTATGANRIAQITNNVSLETLKQLQLMQAQNAAHLQQVAESEAAKAQVDSQMRADVTLGLQQWRKSQANFAQYVEF